MISCSQHNPFLFVSPFRVDNLHVLVFFSKYKLYILSTFLCMCVDFKCFMRIYWVSCFITLRGGCNTPPPSPTSSNISHTIIIIYGNIQCWGGWGVRWRSPFLEMWGLNWFFMIVKSLVLEIISSAVCIELLCIYIIPTHTHTY